MIETKSVLSTRKIQFLCLGITGLMELLMIVIGSSFQGFVQEYLIVPCAVFLGITLVTDQYQRTKKLLIPGLVTVLWFLIALGLQQMAGERPLQSSVSWSAYLLALPFAAALQDGEEQKGLDLFAVCIICASIILSIFSMMLGLGILPASMADSVYWDGARLYAKWHPNTAGRVFFIGAAMTVRFFFRMRSKWGKTAMLLLTALQFVSLTLTNSRTSILILCAFFAGAVFYGIGCKTRGRTIAAFLAAIVTLVAVYEASHLLFEKHNEARVAAYIAELEEKGEKLPDVPISEIKLETDAGQGTLQQDMKSLNGRTYIWGAALKSFLDDPGIQLRGTTNVIEMLQRGGCPFLAEHTHNSWVEMAVDFGIPGLLIALYFTVLTIWNGAYLLLTTKSDPSQKCVAMLLICLMGIGFLSPCLFVGKPYSQYCNVFFFLCLGYMEQWRIAMHGK